MVLLYMSYNKILGDWFSLFTCVSVDGDTKFRLLGSLDTICFAGKGNDVIGYHTSWLLLLGLPVFFIVLLGLPLAAFLKLWNRGKSDDVALLYGFLFSGYKDRFWYWEFISLARKIFISFINIFLSASYVPSIENQHQQGLSALCVLVVSGFATALLKPYNDERMNFLDSLGLLVGSVSVYIGLWTFTAVHSEVGQYMITFLVLLVNVIFLAFVIVLASKGGGVAIKKRCGKLCSCFSGKKKLNIEGDEDAGREKRLAQAGAARKGKERKSQVEMRPLEVVNPVFDTLQRKNKE